MRHARYWITGNFEPAHPEDCRERDTWCPACGCCEHCIHDCDCPDCGCAIAGDRTIPAVHVVHDETPSPISPGVGTDPVTQAEEEA